MQLFPAHDVTRFLRDGWWSGRTWPDLLHQHRAERAGQVSLIDPPNRADFMHGEPLRLTWAQVGDEVDRLAQTLFEHGVRKDSVVGVQLPNCVELPIALLAVSTLGAIVTPFPVQYRRHELAGMGARAGMSAFITVVSALGRRPVDTAVALRDDVTSLSSVLAFGGEAGAGYDLLALGAQSDPSPLLAAYLDALDLNANDCVTLAWTSGTEGSPKGVPRAYGDWGVLGDACAQPGALTGSDVMLNLFPLVNAGGLGGMFLPWIQLGTTLIQHHPFDFDVFVQQIEQEKATYTVAPPLVLDTMISDPDVFMRHDLTSLRALASGSAPLAGWMIQGWETDHGVEVFNQFGSNEGGILFADPDTVPDPAKRGRLFPRYGVDGMPYRNKVATAMSGRLVDLQTGLEITEPGLAGELRLKGPTIMAGYWEMGRHGFDDDGWFCTGDVFEISTEDPDYLVHVDRAKDLIIRGGFKISAAEIEALVGSDRRLREVAAVAMPDARLGERLCLFVVPRDVSAVPTLQEIIADLESQEVAKFKWPERLEVVDELPRNAIGKILKRDLRARVSGEAGVSAN